MRSLTGLLACLIVFLITTEDSYSQDEITRYDNILNPWVLNPAITGSRNSLNFYANKQWFGIREAPTFLGFHINGKLAPFDFYTNRMHINKSAYKSRGRVGLGAALVTDRNGPFSFTELKLNYSYHISFLKNHLSFGLSNDFESYGINEKSMDPLVPGDPQIQGINRSRILYNTGFGVLFYGDSFNAGFAINNIFAEKIVLKDDFIGNDNISRIFACHGSYTISFPGEISFEPAVMIGTTSFNDLHYDISGNVTYMGKYSLCVTYRSLNMLIFHAGIDLGKYGIIYGYSNPFSNISKYAYGSHEITLSMKFGQYIY